MGCAHTAHVGYPKWDWGAPEKFSSKEWETGDLTIMQDWYWDTRTWGLNLKWKVVTCNVSHQFPIKNGEDYSQPGLSRMGTTAESYTRLGETENVTR